MPVTESAERGAECWPCPTSTFKDTAIVRFRSDKGPNFPREEFLESRCPFRFSSAALCPPPRCPTESWGCRRRGWRRLARHGPPADCRLSVHLAPPSSTPSPRACPPLGPHAHLTSVTQRTCEVLSTGGDSGQGSPTTGPGLHSQEGAELVPAPRTSCPTFNSQAVTTLWGAPAWAWLPGCSHRQ